MNGVPWDAATARELGIAWLESELVPAGPLGRGAARRERAPRRGEEAELRSRIGAVARAAERFGDESALALAALFAALPDPSAALAAAPPSDADLFSLVTFARGIAELAAFEPGAGVDGEAAFDPEIVAELDALARALQPQGAQSGFYLGDELEPSLPALRDAAERARERAALARSRTAARVAAALGRTVLDGPQFVVMRDEVSGPLPEGAHIVSEGATYLVCELALDEGAREALAASEAAEAAVAEREESARRRLGALVAARASAIESAARRAGELDAFHARVRFARTHAGCVPEIVTGPEFALDDARYLPIAAALSAQGRAYVPISLAVRGAAAITGPNMGGKSVALRTCGFALACLVYGVPIPARAARLPLVDHATWLGSRSAAHECAIENEAVLSAFGHEVVEARAALARGSEPSLALVLLDEFARTTTPREGRALLAAMLETLRERGALALAATHFDGVAEAAGAAQYAVAGLREPLSPIEGERETIDALDDALRRVARAMDYRLVLVERGARARSDALELAGALGLDGRVIERARALIDGGRQDFEKD